MPLAQVRRSDAARRDYFYLVSQGFRHVSFNRVVVVISFRGFPQFDSLAFAYFTINVVTLRTLAHSFDIRFYFP